MQERMTSLEVKVAFIENQIMELDGVIRDLASRLGALIEEFETVKQETQGSMEERGLGDEKPPHY